MITPRMLALCLYAVVCSPVAALGVGEFAFPSAVVKISSASWAKPFEVEVMKAPNFRGGVVKEFGDPAGSSRVRKEPLTWQFVGKSDFGDVYVVAFARNGGGQDIVPIVFDGHGPAVAERGNTRVEIFLPRT